MKVVRGPNDVFVGVLLLLFSAAGFWLSDGLRVGTITGMGPGYVPIALCWCLAVLGAITIGRGVIAEDDPAEGWSLRPIVFIAAAIVWFALVIEPLGLIVATLGVVLIASFADPASRRWEGIVLGLGLAVFCAAVFIYALGLPMDSLPRGLR